MLKWLTVHLKWQQQSGCQVRISECLLHNRVTDRIRISEDPNIRESGYPLTTLIFTAVLNTQWLLSVICLKAPNTYVLWSFVFCGSTTAAEQNNRPKMSLHWISYRPRVKIRSYFHIWPNPAGFDCRIWSRISAHDWTLKMVKNLHFKNTMLL